MSTTDIAIIGGGIAGASLAAELAAHRRVLLIEAEAQPGYHATGRSAAFWSETYGGPHIQPLTTASRAFLATPSADFSGSGFLSPRGAIHIVHKSRVARLSSFRDEFAGQDVVLQPLTAPTLHSRIPGLRDDWAYGIAEPACSDIDVSALHSVYLKALRRHGGQILNNMRVTAISRRSRGWRIEAGFETIDCSVLVDAAGAWADDIAHLAGVAPLGIAPYRRTVIQLRIDPRAPVDLPLVIDVEGGFYFKGEAGGRIWLSPHDETPSAPCDTAPEELDIARAIDRLGQVVDWRVERVERAWAGLRSFAHDRLPVYGYDPAADGFFWCAGQGGFGIQTAPAAAKLAAALLLGNMPDESVAHIDPRVYAPERLR